MVNSMKKPSQSNEEIKISSESVDVYYGGKQALFDVSLDIEKNSVTSFIGPSGCGKILRKT